MQFSDAELPFVAFIVISFCTRSAYREILGGHPVRRLLKSSNILVWGMITQILLFIAAGKGEAGAIFIPVHQVSQRLVALGHIKDHVAAGQAASGQGAAGVFHLASVPGRFQRDSIQGDALPPAEFLKHALELAAAVHLKFNNPGEARGGHPAAWLYAGAWMALEDTSRPGEYLVAPPVLIYPQVIQLEHAKMAAASETLLGIHAGKPLTAALVGIAAGDFDRRPRFTDALPHRNSAEEARLGGARRPGKAGIVLTPLNIAELAADLLEVGQDDAIYNNCAGAGGFLVSAMKRMIEAAGGDRKKEAAIKAHGLVRVGF